MSLPDVKVLIVNHRKLSLFGHVRRHDTLSKITLQGSEKAVVANRGRARSRNKHTPVIEVDAANSRRQTSMGNHHGEVSVGEPQRRPGITGI